MGFGNGSQITAKQINQQFKIPYSKLNHYTNLGLFTIVSKIGNKRLYDRGEVEVRYPLISKLAVEGYPLNLIRKKILSSAGHELL